MQTVILGLQHLQNHKTSLSKINLGMPSGDMLFSRYIYMEVGLASVLLNHINTKPSSEQLKRATIVPGYKVMRFVSKLSQTVMAWESIRTDL